MLVLKKLEEITDKQDKLSFLFQNKAEIKRAKKDLGKNFATSYSVCSNVSISQSKALNIELSSNEFYIVGNSVGFFDSHKDVSIRGSWDKTVSERGDRIPIIKDHRMSVDNLFAENLGTSIQEIDIKDLGFDKEGTTQVVGAKIKPIDPIMLEKYTNGLIKEHSVGLRYVQLDLAINDPEFDEEFKIWNQFAGQIINIDDAMQKGFFWAVKEQKLIEISAVVLGSNPYTPALKSLDKEPHKSTQKVEPTNTHILSTLIR